MTRCWMRYLVSRKDSRTGTWDIMRCGMIGGAKDGGGGMPGGGAPGTMPGGTMPGDTMPGTGGAGGMPAGEP